MSKMSEMEATIRELRDIASSINDIANWLTGAFSGSEEAAPAPEPEKALTLEEVRVILAEKSRDGFTAQMETLQELIRRLRKAGAKSDATRGCGVHIHIGANGHTAQTLRNLANIMASHESLLASALNLDRNRMSRYCRTVSKDFLVELNRKKPKTMAALADTWYGSQHANYGRDQHYNDSRYHMLKGNYNQTKSRLVKALLNSDITITARKYVGHEDDTGYNHYAIDVAKEYGLEEI